jgi:MFS family permease
MLPDPRRVTPAETPESRLPANVWILGAVALFNDTATEMSYWLLPQFLVGVLKAGPAAFGLIEGAAETAASLARLASGFVSDRLRRRKVLTAIGYTISNVAKPLLALVRSWPQVFWIRFFDRAAKGFRAAPRDALIADSASSSQRGAAFGLLQSMDTAGAILGPLAAIALLAHWGGNVRRVFWMAGAPGLVSLLLAWLAVREIPPCPLPAGPGTPPREPWFGNRALRLILLGSAVFALGNSSDLFLILRAENLGVRAALAPVLGLIFNLVYTAASWPAGALSDRISRRSLVVSGFLIYAVVYLGFARATSPRIMWLLFPFYGLYYALTEGVLKAWIADLLPSESRASAFGVFNWVTGVCALPASTLAGWLWRHYAPSTPFYVSAALATTAGVLLLLA